MTTATRASENGCFVGKACDVPACNDTLGGSSRSCSVCNGGWCAGGKCASCGNSGGGNTGGGGNSGGSSGGSKLVQCRSKNINCNVDACNDTKGGSSRTCSACGGGWCNGGVCETCSESVFNGGGGGGSAGQPPAGGGNNGGGNTGGSCTPGSKKGEFCDNWTNPNSPFIVEVYYTSSCGDEQRVTTRSCGSGGGNTGGGNNGGGNTGGGNTSCPSGQMPGAQCVSSCQSETQRCKFISGDCYQCVPRESSGGGNTGGGNTGGGNTGGGNTGGGNTGGGNTGGGNTGGGNTNSSCSVRVKFVENDGSTAVQGVELSVKVPGGGEYFGTSDASGEFRTGFTATSSGGNSVELTIAGNKTGYSDVSVTKRVTPPGNDGVCLETIKIAKAGSAPPNNDGCGSGNYPSSTCNGQCSSGQTCTSIGDNCYTCRGNSQPAGETCAVQVSVTDQSGIVKNANVTIDQTGAGSSTGTTGDTGVYTTSNKFKSGSITVNASKQGYKSKQITANITAPNCGTNVTLEPEGSSGGGQTCEQRSGHSSQAACNQNCDSSKARCQSESSSSCYFCVALPQSDLDKQQRKQVCQEEGGKVSPPYPLIEEEKGLCSNPTSKEFNGVTCYRCIPPGGDEPSCTVRNCPNTSQTKYSMKHKQNSTAYDYFGGSSCSGQPIATSVSAVTEEWCKTQERTFSFKVSLRFTNPQNYSDTSIPVQLIRFEGSGNDGTTVGGPTNCNFTRSNPTCSVTFSYKSTEENLKKSQFSVWAKPYSDNIYIRAEPRTSIGVVADRYDFSMTFR